MAPEENEAVIDYFVRHNPDAIVQDMSALASHLTNITPPITEWNGKTYDTQVNHVLRLKPSHEVEAFFVATIKKEQQ